MIRSLRVMQDLNKLSRGRAYQMSKDPNRKSSSYVQAGYSYSAHSKSRLRRNQESYDYVVISPIYNEEERIGEVIRSVIAQTIVPKEFVIVDDASSDRSLEVALTYADRHQFIKVIRHHRSGGYSLETAEEAKAFIKGVSYITSHYDFLAKLDGDVSLEPVYFESLLKKFHRELKLGIASGCCYHIQDGRLSLEQTPRKHVRGAARVYRRQCWEEIGGIKDRLGWDVVDLVQARMLGWETISFPDLRIIHHVPTGTKAGFLRGCIRSGREEFLIGTHPLFLLVKTISRMVRRPVLRKVLGGLMVLWGYSRSFLMREERVSEPEVMCFLRIEQLKRLVESAGSLLKVTRFPTSPS